MRNMLYRFITALSRRTGLWVFQLFAWFVATGYFILFPGRVGNSTRIYKALYPDRHRFYHLWCAWRQFHNFTHLYQDRFVLQHSKELNTTSEGMQHLKDVVLKGKGAILLMSHMGNWEMAAHLLKR